MFLFGNAYVKLEKCEDPNNDSHWIRAYNIIDAAVGVKQVEDLLIKL
jgi:hypothetical protein